MWMGSFQQSFHLQLPPKATFLEGPWPLVFPKGFVAQRARRWLWWVGLTPCYLWLWPALDFASERICLGGENNLRGRGFGSRWQGSSIVVPRWCYPIHHHHIMIYIYLHMHTLVSPSLNIRACILACLHTIQKYTKIQLTLSSRVLATACNLCNH